MAGRPREHRKVLAVEKTNRELNGDVDQPGYDREAAKTSEAG